MKASVLAPAPIEVEPPLVNVAPARPMRARVNSSCLTSVARVLLWATRNS